MPDFKSQREETVRHELIDRGIHDQNVSEASASAPGEMAPSGQPLYLLSLLGRPGSGKSSAGAPSLRRTLQV